MTPGQDSDRASLSGIASALRDVFGFDEVVLGERLRGGYANDARE
jgi:hypothetical protein